MAIRPGNAPLNCIALTAAGSTLADATQIPVNASPALITATGNGTVGIKLPASVAGKVYTIKNLGGSALLVYPYAAGDQINAITAGTEISMAALTCATFSCMNSTTWYTTPLLPS